VEKSRQFIFFPFFVMLEKKLKNQTQSRDKTDAHYRKKNGKN
jgi:hypothetical protein